jgi:cardiolipin synthase
MSTLPNVITFVRLALIPVVAAALANGAYAVALPAFLAAALSDAADGYIARRFNWVSPLGATLDPIADKLNMLVATLFLAWQELLPLWLAVAIVARDVVIVAGALAYRAVIGHLDIAPTWLSKFNTVIEFSLLALLMGVGAGWIERGVWMPIAFALTGVTVVASGAQYVWVYGRRALHESRAR